MSAAACMAGVQAEFDGNLERARQCFREAWHRAADDHDRCVAAHYVAHLERDPAAAHAWNLEAMRFAMHIAPEQAATFMASLVVSLGRTHELLGHAGEAAECYERARQLGLEHSPAMTQAPWLERGA